MNKCMVIWEDMKTGCNKIKIVKNLGWMIRKTVNASIGSIDVYLYDDRDYDATMYVYFEDKHTFVISFQDRTILWSFLNRPCLSGYHVNWNGVDYELNPRNKYNYPGSKQNE